MLGEAAARTLAAVLPDCVAVIGLADQVLEARFRALGMTVIRNPGAASGIATSLACGIRARPRASGWLVALADMPSIRPATVAAVARALQEGAPIAAPSWHGRRGHPVGFGAAFQAELLALADGPRPDQGARTLLRRHANRIRLLPVDDPGILQDVDRPADLRTGPSRSTPGACGPQPRRDPV